MLKIAPIFTLFLLLLPTLSSANCVFSQSDLGEERLYVSPSRLYPYVEDNMRYLECGKNGCDKGVIIHTTGITYLNGKYPNVQSYKCMKAGIYYWQPITTNVQNCMDLHKDYTWEDWADFITSHDPDTNLITSVSDDTFLFCKTNIGPLRFCEHTDIECGMTKDEWQHTIDWLNFVMKKLNEEAEQQTDDNQGSPVSKQQTRSEEFCGVKCNTDTVDKTVVCPGGINNTVTIKRCDKDGWSEVSAYACPGRANDSIPKDYKQIGIHKGDPEIEHMVVYVKKDSKTKGKGYVFVEENIDSKDVCTGCERGYKIDDIEKAKPNCILNNESDDLNKSCNKKHKGNAVAIACCESADAEWNDKTNVCTCNDASKQWKYDEDNKTGKCEEVEKVMATPCKYVFRTNIECSNGTIYNESKEYILNKEDVDKIGTCDAVKTKLSSFEKLVEHSTKIVTEQNEIIELICGSDATGVIPPSVKTEINNAQKTLKSFFNRAKENASVWETEDGNFNGSRLASDLTAGVVLGTVGGVVSSNIIKKNQIKSGFEVLHCAIGGQIVADWGDEFTVRPNGR